MRPPDSPERERPACLALRSIAGRWRAGSAVVNELHGVNPVQRGRDYPSEIRPSTISRTYGVNCAVMVMPQLNNGKNGFNGVKIARGRRRLLREEKEKGGDIMPISTQYAVLSEDKATILLPKDVQEWVRDVERFVVVVENDELILRKTYSRRSLDEMVTREEAPLPEEKLEELIHETRI
jgi:hypothetical protein